MSHATSHYILIIDPDNIVGDIFPLVLERKCHDTIQIVLSRAEGLASLQTRPPTAIFIYLWAEGVSAAEFCQWLKAMPEFQHLPVLVWGMMDPEKVYAELRQAGAAGYLYMPCGPDQIIAARDAVVSGEEFYP